MSRSYRESSAAWGATTVGAALALAMLVVAPFPVFAAVIPPPEGARLVNFDDVDSAPTSFGATIALRGRYQHLGINFSAPGSDGGAILGQGAGFSVTGFSPPNYLAFNVAAGLQGGGTAKLPETLLFRQPVSYVQLNIGDTSGLSITVEARDGDGALVDVDTDLGTAAMQTFVVEGRHIARVDVFADGLEVVIDDIAFVLDSTVVDFDDVVAAFSFATATAVRDRYDNRSVEFLHIMPNDGPAILHQSANLGVTGFSEPNYLALDDTATLVNGGKPKFPLYMQFFPPVKKVEFLVGDAGGSTIDVEASTWGAETVDTASIAATAAMQPVLLEGPSITSVVVTSSGGKAVLDDLKFLVDGTVIDFDDNTNPSNIFNEATALRERYADLGVHFTAPGNDGPAVLAYNVGFGTNLHSGANVLAADAGDGLANGAIPRLPMTIEFDRPLKSEELRAADPAGSRIFFEGRDALDQVTVTSDIFGTATFEHVPLHFEGTTRLIVTGSGNTAFFDDLAFTEMDACEHDPCYQGSEMNRYCSVCVTKICNENSDCCNDGWDQTCAESTDTVCETTCLPLCGDANVDRRVSAPDALVALKTAVNDGTVCAKFRCDFNGDDKVLSGDALQILRTAVGQPTNPNCPPEPS